MIFSRIISPSKQFLRCVGRRQLHYDVVIVGGGVMGSSSAFFIKEKAPSMKVAVVERDCTYTEAATPKSVGSIREQFSNVENIKMSQWSYKFLTEARSRLSTNGDEPDIGFVPGSYMFLASEKGKEILENNCETQRRHGVDIDCLSADELKKKCEWINMEGVACGSMYYGNKEGFFDPWSLLMAFRKKAESLGVKYFDGRCISIGIQSKINNVKVVKDDEETELLQCSSLVNASGPWAGELMETIGVKLPVEPRKRYVYAIDCPKGPGRDMPLAIDPTGVYCRPEGSGTLYLCGCSPEEAEEPDPCNLEVDYDYFDHFIWPILANRYVGMEELKLRHSWAGYYDYNTLDQNGIIGVHNDIENLYFANGFSGHGIQQSPAVGNAISELILDGKFQEIDLSNLGYDRIVQNKPVFEINVV